MSMNTSLWLLGGIALLCFASAIAAGIWRALRREESWKRKLVSSVILSLMCCIPIGSTAGTMAFYHMHYLPKTHMDYLRSLPGSESLSTLDRGIGRVERVMLNGGAVVEITVMPLEQCVAAGFGVALSTAFFGWVPIWAVVRFIKPRPAPRGFSVIETSQPEVGLSR